MTFREIIRAEAEAILNIPFTDAIMDNVLTVIHTLQIASEHGKIITTGVGKAGLVAQYMADLLTSTGSASIFLHPTEAMHGGFGIISEKDCILFFSNSGQTDELLLLLKKVNSTFPTVATILITGKPLSKLGNKVDLVIFTGSPAEVCPLGLSPTTSITTMIVICHLISTRLMLFKDFSIADYYKNHHSGYIGHLLKEKLNDQKSKDTELSKS